MSEAEEFTVEIKRLPGSEGLALPCYMTAGASAMDVCAAVAESVTIQPGQVCVIPTGFAVSIPAGFEGQIRPRSGLAVEHGITLINSPATIDSDYRGELKVPLINHSSSPFEVQRGARIAQLAIAPVKRVRWRESEQLAPTERDTKSFGHTGR